MGCSFHFYLFGLALSTILCMAKDIKAKTREKGGRICQ